MNYPSKHETFTRSEDLYQRKKNAKVVVQEQDEKNTIQSVKYDSKFVKKGSHIELGKYDMLPFCTSANKYRKGTFSKKLVIGNYNCIQLYMVLLALMVYMRIDL